jgi:hypothetical protein
VSYPIAFNPHTAHGVTMDQNACAQRAISDFLDDPMAETDVSCFLNLPPVSWRWLTGRHAHPSGRYSGIGRSASGIGQEAALADGVRLCIEPGMTADLMVLRADPTGDVALVRPPALAIKGGERSAGPDSNVPEVTRV